MHFLLFQLDQTSLGLPTRDYFLQPSNRAYLLAYQDYLITIANMLGAPLGNATTEAENIIEFETQLAQVSEFLNGSIFVDTKHIDPYYVSTNKSIL